MYLVNKIKEKISSEFVKNSAILLIANLISQIVAIIVYPIITRQYQPEDLGVLALFLSIGTIGFDLASAKYDSAIMIEKRDKLAGSIFDLILLINLIVCLIFWGFITFFKNWFITTFELESVAKYLFYIPIFIFFSRLNSSFQYWFNRNERFKLTARNMIVQSSANSILKVLFGFLKMTKIGLILSTLFGQILAAFAIIFRNRNYSKYIYRFNRKEMVTMAKKYAHFPLFTLPQSLVNTISGQIPIFILAPAFGMTEVGFFSLALTIGQKPITVFCSSMYQIFFQKVSQNKNNHISSFLLIKKFCLNISLVFLPIFIILGIFMPQIVTFLFGDGWYNSAVYLQIMMPWFFLTLLTSSLNYTPLIAGKQATALVLEILYAAIRIILLLIGVYYKDVKLAFILYSLGSTIFLLGQLIWYLYLTKNLKYEEDSIE